MKIFGVVLYACVVLALAEGRTRVRRDAVVGDAWEAEHQLTGSGPHGCRVVTSLDSDDTPNPSNVLMNEVIYCVANAEDVERFNNLTQLEEYRQFFGGYCSHLPKVKKCLEGKEEKVPHCVNATEQNTVRIFIGFMRSVVDTGCANQGELIATIVHGLETQNDQERHIISQCTNEVGLNLKDLKDCLIGKIKVGNEELKTQVRSFMDDIIRDLQCVDPAHNTLVLCSSIASD